MALKVGKSNPGAGLSADGEASQADMFAGPSASPVSKPLPPRLTAPVPARSAFVPRSVQAPAAPSRRPPLTGAARPPLATPRSSAAVAKPRTGGYTEAPPPKGSPYRDFIEWACDQHLLYEDAEKLALDFFLGKRNPDDEEPSNGFRR